VHIAGCIVAVRNEDCSELVGIVDVPMVVRHDVVEGIEHLGNACNRLVELLGLLFAVAEASLGESGRAVCGWFICVYDGSSTTSLPQLSYWFLIPYISSVLLTLFVAAVFGVYLYGRFREVGSSTLVFLLPTSIVLLWIPFFVVLIMLLSGFLPVNSYTSKLMSALFLLAMQCGVPLVMAHYATKVKLRQKWWKLVVEGVIQRPSNIRSSFLSEVESSMWRGTAAEPSLMSVSGPDLPDLTDGWAEARARSVGVGGGWS